MTTSQIVLADALDWLREQPPGAARAIVWDPPYSRGGPMRGRPDGMAGQVAAPWKFMHQTLSLCAKAVMPHGLVICFGDYELLPDLEYLCSITGLREQAHFTWIRSRPGGGWLFRSACDPILLASPLSPDRVDVAAVKNWFEADYEIPRSHPYSKPPELIEYILARVCQPRRPRARPVRRVRLVPDGGGEAGAGLARVRHRPAVP